MNELLLEAARNTPVIAKPDVLVVGGGAAGLGAAMAAARSGASTLLVERQGFLGGTLTAVTLGTLCGGYVVKGNEHRQIVGGIYANLVDRLSQRKASLPPRRWLNNVSVPYDPSALRIEADRMAESAGIRLLLHTLVVGTQVTEGRITAVLVEHKGGRGAIIPRLVIDASGDGDVAAQSGVDFTIGDSGHTQFPSTMLSFGGVNINRFLEISREERLDRLAQAAADGYPLPRTSAGLQVHPGEGIVHANVTRIRNPDGSSPDMLDPDVLTFAEIEGRRQALVYEEVLQRYMPGFENARIVTMGTQIGVRETRLIECDHRLNEQEVRQGHRPADTIALCGWPMETHGSDSGTVWDWLPEGSCYGIPYRCLTAKGLSNLLVAGRNLSATHAAQSSARVAATCIAMGEAAGTAATMALDRKSDIRAIDISALRKALLDAGALLD
jgi:hypothetical protein